MHQVKVLLVQLGSTGDCLLVTPIARQIKEINYPGCKLTWLIISKFVPAIMNNPYVDEIIEIPYISFDDIQKQKDSISQYISEIGGNKSYDKIFCTDYNEFNSKYYYGTIRSSLFRCYPHQLKVNPEPLVFLNDKEINNVAQFCKKNGIANHTFNVIFECAPTSGQSLMTFEKAYEIAEDITSKDLKIKIILSSNQSFTSNNPNVIDGSSISWRENAELSKFCHMLVGCSSGISWLCTSNYAKKIPFIQVINPNFAGSRYFASLKNDFRYFGLEAKYLIELYNPSDVILKKCIWYAINNNFEKARKKFNIRDNSLFYDYRFLKEAKINGFEKFFLYLRYYLIKILKLIIKVYKTFKPNWFTPRVWLNAQDLKKC